MQETRGLTAKLFYYFMCTKQLTCKIHKNVWKNPKIAKPVLLESRNVNLQLLLIKFGMKLNVF
jgi:hypothetical protein